MCAEVRGFGSRSDNEDTSGHTRAHALKELIHARPTHLKKLQLVWHARVEREPGRMARLDGESDPYSQEAREVSSMRASLTCASDLGTDNTRRLRSRGKGVARALTTSLKLNTRGA